MNLLKLVEDVIELFSLLECPYRQTDLLAKEERAQLDEFLHLIIPARRKETCFTDRLLLSAEHVVSYITRVDRDVVGTTYKAIWLLVKRLRGGGVFESVFSSHAFVCSASECLNNVDCDNGTVLLDVPSNNGTGTPMLQNHSSDVSGIDCKLSTSTVGPCFDQGPSQVKHTLRYAAWKFGCSVCCKSFSATTSLRSHVILQHVVSKLPIARKLQFWKMLQRRSIRLWRCVRCVYCSKLLGLGNSLPRHRAVCSQLTSAANKRLYKKEHAGYEMSKLNDSNFKRLPVRSPTQSSSRPPADDYVKVLDLPGTKSRIQSFKVRRTMKYYSCSHCSKRFLSSPSLIRHSQIHSDVRPFVCRHCNKAFFDKSNCSKHELRHVPCSQRPMCTCCHKRFLSVFCLNRHVNGYRENRRCPLCGARHVKCASAGTSVSGKRDNASDDELDGVHIPTCFENAESSTLCGGVSSASDYVDESEMRNRKPSRCGLKVHRSSFRRQLTVKIGGVKRHPKIIAADGLQSVVKKNKSSESDGKTAKVSTKYRCPECGKYLATKSNLERHYRLHIGDRPFECEFCGREFSDLSNLRKHEQVHSGEQLANISGHDSEDTQDTTMNSPGGVADDCSTACDRPNNIDSDKSILETLDGVEAGRKAKGQPTEYPCFACRKVFLYRSHLYEHIKVHTDDRPYQCEVCGKAFKRTGDLTTHARFHDAEKQFECIDCGQRFRWKNGLERHRRIHTGERPFLCTVCGRSFADWGSHKQHVQSHMLLVAGVEPERFPCKVCGKTFAWKRGLARHARSHAAGKPGKGF